MITFSNDLQNGLCIRRNHSFLLSGICVWMNPALFQNNAGSSDGKFYLSLLSSDETCAEFASGDGVASLKLTLFCRSDRMALRAEGHFDPTGHPEYGSHLDPKLGFGLDFDLPHTGAYTDLFMNCRFWQRPLVKSTLSELHPRTQSLFMTQGQSKSYYLTCCDVDYKTELFPAEQGVTLIAHSGAAVDDFKETLLLASFGRDLYTLPEKAVAYGLKIMKKKGKLRHEKAYPEILEYLGFCSWDAFHMDITSDDILKKSREFQAKNIPVRWMILDDMWADVPAIDRKTMHTRELRRWEADPLRFPEGLKGAIQALHAESDMQVGIWHPTTGYWNGIDPTGPLAKEQAELLDFTLPFTASGDMASWDAPKLMHSFDPKKAAKYYDRQHAFYKDCGIAFTKIDNQGSTEALSYRRYSIGKASSALHRAIEGAAEKYYGGGLINCMGMPIENFWNREKSTVNRFSGDFQPENRKWFIQHLLQCSFNCLTQGALYVGDWDMWWSDDAQAQKNAVLRAMSGGPVYVSDELGRSVAAVLSPLCFEDGRLLRLPEPALPAPDCVMTDNEHSGKPFKVMNHAGSCGILSLFNLDENENPVRGKISSADVRGLENRDYVLYDWFSGKAVLLKAGETLPITLENYDDFRLYILAPLEKGRAVIGLAEKYMTPLTYHMEGNTLTPLADGHMRIFSLHGLSGWQKIGESLYEKEVKKGESLTIDQN